MPTVADFKDYVCTLDTEEGLVNITIHAQSEQRAVDYLIASEHCPRHSVMAVRPL